MKGELFKAAKQKLLRIIFVLFNVFSVSIAFYMKNESSMQNGIYTYGGIAPFIAPYMFDIIEMMLFSIFTAIFIGNEFQRKTLHNMISRGVRREKYYINKLIVICGCVSIVHLSGVIVFSIFRITMSGFGENIIFQNYVIKLLVYTVVTLIEIWAFVSFFVMCAFIVGKVGFAVILCVASVYVEAYFGQMAIAGGIKILTYTPQYMLYNLFNSFVLENKILTLKFISCSCSGIFILLMTTLIGIWIFSKKDLV